MLPQLNQILALYFIPFFPFLDRCALRSSAWGRPPPKYTCDICVVTVPCYDTLVKHRQGKEHIKREMDMEVGLLKVQVFWKVLGNKFLRRGGRGMAETTRPGKNPRDHQRTPGDIRCGISNANLACQLMIGEDQTILDACQ